MNATPRITFHGGIGTIGGTKIIIEEGGHRVLFDFGLSYAPGGDFWGGRLQPRSGAAGLRDYVALGYMPLLDGLYRTGEAEALELEPATGGTTQVFISHLHLDHMAVVHFLADELPVWMHRDSLALFRAVAETGEQPAVPAGARGFHWGEVIEVGPIKVTPVAVDHDIPGASALLIETSAGTVVYTGDLRLHGPEPAVTERFMELARAVRPKILLIEGTRLGEEPGAPDRPPSLSENEVPGRVLEHLQDRSGLALITFYPRNTLRISRIAETVGQVGRKLVLSAEVAHIWEAMGGDLRQVALYRRHRDAEALARRTAPEWLARLMASGVELLDAGAVRQRPEAYLLQLPFADLNELVDLQPPAGSVFIHSNGEPLGRFDPMFDLFTRWLDRFGVELLFAPSTGHASPADLHRIVEEIQPQVLMPIHSRAPELLEPAGIRRVLPELGASYAIDTGERLG
ncbi:MAG: MBL fold metallo-hydrolase [Bacillota bacterium]